MSSTVSDSVSDPPVSTTDENESASDVKAELPIPTPTISSVNPNSTQLKGDNEDDADADATVTDPVEMKTSSATVTAEPVPTLPTPKDELVADELNIDEASNNDIPMEMESADADSVEKNPYAYLERDEFCSERFKLELRNLPKQYGFKELKKFMMKLKLNPHKIKKGNSSGHFMFISFRSIEDRDKAIGTLNGQKWKNKILVAHLANAAKDPLIKIRKDFKERATESSDTKEELTEPLDEIMKKVTIPWHNIPYDEQLAKKDESVNAYMLELVKQLCFTNFELKKLETPMWESESILPSPVTSHYRNKCEFTIGINPKTGEKTVGFRLTSYKQGSKAVGPVSDLAHLPLPMIGAAVAVEEFIRNSAYEPYDPETHFGVWKQLTVRTNSEGHIMLIFIVSSRDIDAEEEKKLKEELTAHFQKIKDLQITSLLFKTLEVQGHQTKNPLELLFGDGFLREEMCGFKFRISPESFFQVNTKGAENLVKAIQAHAELDEDTCLLDICCGTGTLGLCLAQYCGEVHGVEMIQSAVQDARVNATENGLESKCQFYCGKAEDLVDALTYQTKKKKIVAIVDPPRAGVHMKVLQTLRRCPRINKIIYVSCDAEAAKRNFIDFARPESKKYRLSPFVPRRVIPVDLFPMSHHMELIVVLKRIFDESPQESENGNKVEGSKEESQPAVSL